MRRVRIVVSLVSMRLIVASYPTDRCNQAHDPRAEIEAMMAVGTWHLEAVEQTVCGTRDLVWFEFVLVDEEYAFDDHLRVHLRHSFPQTSCRVKPLVIEISDSWCHFPLISCQDVVAGWRGQSWHLTLSGFLRRLSSERSYGPSSSFAFVLRMVCGRLR